MDAGVVVYVWGDEGFAREVGDTITELAMKSHDEAAVIEVQCMADGVGGVTAIAVGREV